MNNRLTRQYVKATRRIPGWFWPAAAYLFAMLDEIQKADGVTGNLFEIGAYHGKSAILLGGMADRQREQLGVCDNFGDHDGDASRSGRGFYRAFMRNVRRFFPEHGFLHVHCRSSVDLTVSETTDNCRLFHIDGGHDADLVVNDLRIADQAVADRGLVVLDDMYNSAWPEVTEGFFRFIAARPGAFVPLVIGFNKAVLARPGSCEPYRRWFGDPDRCWQHVPRGPYALKTVRFCETETFVFHVRSYRSPDLRRSLLAMLYYHRPLLADRLARLLRYHEPRRQLQPVCS